MRDEENAYLQSVGAIGAPKFPHRVVAALTALAISFSAVAWFGYRTPFAKLPEVQSFPLAHFMDLQINAFEDATVIDRKTGADRDGPISFLDRQNLDCGPVQGVMTGFQLHPGGETSISFSYSCSSFKNSIEMSKIVKKTDEGTGRGGVESLKQYRVYCDDNSLMTRWSGLTERGAFCIEYYCKTYNIGEYFCHDKNTEYAPVVRAFSTTHNDFARCRHIATTIHLFLFLCYNNRDQTTA
jgi:hypothetical protein